MRITLTGQKSNYSLPAHPTPPPPRAGVAAVPGSWAAPRAPQEPPAALGGPAQRLRPAAPPCGPQRRKSASLAEIRQRPPRGTCLLPRGLRAKISLG